jgi:hypothetical protein
MQQKVYQMFDGETQYSDINIQRQGAEVKNMKEEDMPSPVEGTGNEKKTQKEGKSGRRRIAKGNIGWTEHDSVARQTRPHVNYLAEFQEVMENYKKKNQELHEMKRGGQDSDLGVDGKLYYERTTPGKDDEAA